ncbi:MAG: CHASE sensor domain-containing protein [Rhodanobacter sp.]
MNARPDRKPLPFRPAMMVVAVGLLVLAGALATAYQYHAARIEHRRQLVTQANILAASVTAAIAFDDRVAAQEYVNALKLDPRLDAAAVYNEAHRQVAGFHREGSAPIADGGSGAGDPRLVAVPARQGSTTVGRVYLRAAELPLIVQLTRYSGVVLLTIMAVLMLSALAVAQGVLTRAHASLRKRAEELVEANRRLSVEMEQRAHRGGAAAKPEDGSHRPALRRHRARLQQPADDHQGQPDPVAGQVAQGRPGRRAARPGGA